MKYFVAVLVILLGIALAPFVLLFGLGVGEEAIAAEEMPPSYCVSDPGTLPDDVPEPLNSIFTETANYYDVPPSVLAAVYYIENWTGDRDWRGKPAPPWREPPSPYGEGPLWPSSPAGASGPFQFMPGTWLIYGRSNPSGKLGNINDLTDSAFAAAHYLSVLGAVNGAPLGTPETRSTQPSVMNALARYNAGENPGNWVNPETNDYLAKAEWFLAPYYDGTITPPGDDDPGDGDEPEPVDPEFDPCDAPPFEGGDGYPDTDHMTCEIGRDGGVFQTAQGNRIRICVLSNGLTVNASIEGQYQAVVSQMESRGYPLVVTDGFRTLNDQLDRRRVNCGPTYYDLWLKPSTECVPDTAIPGTSRHEQGLAGDFAGFYYHNDQFIEMNRVAPPRGICNFYPIEPWHWDDTSCKFQ